MAGAGGAQALEAQAAKALIDLATLKDYDNERRAYVGASGIGNPCLAYQQLSLRGFPSDVPDAGLIRIFREGKRLEDVVVADLKAAGFDVAEIDPATGKQWKFTALGGHYKANLDGLITNAPVPTTLEIKSMNKVMFAKLVNHGVAKSHPEYYSQVQAGMDLMHHNGKDADRCMFVAINKENLDYHIEYVTFDPDHALLLRGRASAVIGINQAGKRMSKFAKAWDCQRCFKRTACWEPNFGPEQRDCRMCDYAVPVSAADWNCRLSGAAVPMTPCSSFQLYRPEKA